MMLVWMMVMRIMVMRIMVMGRLKMKGKLRIRRKKKIVC